MNNFKELFKQLDKNTTDYQFLIINNESIKVYYGISKEGKYRLSFLTTKSSGITKSTKNIELVQGYSTENNYWTCFDLSNDALLPAFIAFCDDLVHCVEDARTEDIALRILRSRYNIWKALFRGNQNQMSPEKTKGLYGELYFLKNYMMNKYNLEDSIKSWVGPDGYKKDYSIFNTWYEIKTISCGCSSVKISSLQQLSADLVGHLVVIKAEEMSDRYEVIDCSINYLVTEILNKLKEDNELKELFLTKLSNLGFDFCDDMIDKKYHVQNMDIYLIDDKFPVLKEEEIKSKAISNVSYELILKLIEDYMEV